MLLNQKTSVLMLQGAFGTAESVCWTNYRRMFEDAGYHVITPVLPDYNNHQDLNQNKQLKLSNLDDYTNYVIDIIKTLPEKPFIIGHAIGGLIAQKLASQGYAKGLVAICSAVPADVSGLFQLSLLKNILPKILKWRIWSQSMAFDYALINYNNTNHRSSEQYYNTPLQHYTDESERAAIEMAVWMLDSNRAAHVDTKMVSCPVLIVGAVQDRITPVKMMRKIAKKYLHSTYYEYPDHTHWIITETGWEKPAKNILEWVDVYNESSIKLK